MARDAPGDGVGIVTKAKATMRHFKKRLLDPSDVQAGYLVSTLLIIHEVLLTSLIVGNAGYTEIDWKAYMQEVGAYDSGERNYLKIEGDTGPLVYPAGFVYVYSWLKKITGGKVASAQPLFAVLYTVNLSMVLNIIVNARAMPPIALVTLTLSKRLHSIYVLRLFNDCVAMLPAHMAMLMAQRGVWEGAAVLWSLALGVKMNALLFAPALALLMLRAAPLWRCVACAALAVGVQVALAIPFRGYPSEYFSRAFEFGRQFQYKWSVNWQFVPEEIFLGEMWKVALLAWHLLILAWFVDKRWMVDAGGIRGLVSLAFRRLRGEGPEPGARLSPKYVAAVMWECNFIGIIFARSLHYQFYSWYGFSLPFLAWQTKFPYVYRLLLLAAIEMCWNVYPPSKLFSALLGECHVILLLSVINGAPLRVFAPKALEGAAFGEKPAGAAAGGAKGKAGEGGAKREEAAEATPRKGGGGNKKSN